MAADDCAHDETSRDRRLTILHLINHRHQFNGMVHAAVDLACAQAAQGHDVVVLSGAGDFDALLARHGVKVLTSSEAISMRSALAAARSVRAAIRSTGPDVVHAHMVAAAVIARPVTALARVPLVTSVQNSFSRSAVLMRVGSRVITGCDAVADSMQERGIPRRKLRPILNGVIGSARIEDVTAEPLGDSAAISRPAVVSAGGLHWRKGFPDLIRGFQGAAAIIPDLSLHIFGEGPDAEEFQALADAEPDAKIHFHGQTAVLRPHLEAADVFVLASVADPAPLSICEAREAGLAVIGTKVDGIPELLEHGLAGVLVEPRSPAAITRALLDLFENPARLAEERSKSQYRIDRLSVHRVAQQTVEVYEELLGHRRRRRLPRE